MPYLLTGRFRPDKDIPGILAWWDPSTAPKIIGGDSSNQYTRLIDRAGRFDLLNGAGVIFSLTPTRHASLGVNTAAIVSPSSSSAANMRISVSMAGLGISAATILMAAYKPGNNDNGGFYSHFGGSGVQSLHGYSGDSNVYDDFGSTVRQTFTHVSSFTGSHIWAARSVTGRWNAYLDGLVQFNTTSNTFSFSAAIAAQACIPNSFAAADGMAVYEVLLYRRYLTDSELRAATIYLSNRWRIPIT